MATKNSKVSAKTSPAMASQLIDVIARASSSRPRAPEQVKFLGRIIKVIYKEPTFEQDGEYCAQTHEARIRSGQPIMEEADTVIHELFHGIDAFIDLNLSERQIRLLATAFIGMLKDNPELFHYISQSLGLTEFKAASK